MKKKIFINTIVFLFYTKLLYSNDFLIIKKKLNELFPASNRCYFEFTKNKVNYYKDECYIKEISQEKIIIYFDTNYFLLEPLYDGFLLCTIFYKNTKKSYRLEKDKLISNSKFIVFYYIDPDTKQKKFLQIYFKENDLYITFEYGRILFKII